MALPAQIRRYYDLADNPGDDGTFHGLTAGWFDSVTGDADWPATPFFFTGPSIYTIGIGSRNDPDFPAFGKPWMRAWKSTDGGNTWTNVDTGDEFPVGLYTTAGLGGTGAGYSLHPIGGTAVAVFYQKDDSNVIVANLFDLTSDTWLGPSVGPAAAISNIDNGGFTYRAVPLSDGSHLVMYQKNDFSGIYVSVYDSGWGIEQLVDNTTALLPTAMVPDNAGGAFLFYPDNVGATTNIVYRDGGGGLNTVTNIPLTPRNIVNSPVIVGTNLFVAGLDGTDLKVGVASIIVPGAALTFVYTTISASPDTGTGVINGGMAVVNDGSDHPVLTWTDSTDLLMTYSIDGLGDDWTVSTVIQASYFLGGQLRDTGAGTGRAGFISYGAVPDDPFTYYNEFSLAPVPVPPTITTTTTPGGQQDTPYSFQLVGTGDEPLVWGIISGALPPGLTLDASTGIISGTPTMAGSFYFQVQLSGAASPPAIAPFTIVITPPGGGPWHPQPPWDISAACAKGGAFGLRRVADGIIGDSSTTSDQFLDVFPGQNWFIEFFVRGSETADGVISYGFDWYDVDGNIISSSLIDDTGSPVLVDAGWALFVGTIIAPVGAVQASPRIQAVGHLNGVWCVNALFSAAQDEYFTLSSIKHYYTEYTLYR